MKYWINRVIVQTKTPQNIVFVGYSQSALNENIVML